MPELLVRRSMAAISFKTRESDAIETVEWENASAVVACPLAPWRTFRWWYGQRHYSGTYWSATLRDHVIYESRLELARLLYADFDRGVNSIVAQPFLIEADVDGKRRRHIPDYLLQTASGPVIVDVKPLRFTTVDKIEYTLAWTRQLIEDLGWDYEVWSEPPPIELANLRFLAGYRNESQMNQDLIGSLQTARLHGLSIGQAIRACTAWPEPVVRAGVCHLLWRGTVQTDLHSTLQSTSVLRKGAI